MTLFQVSKQKKRWLLKEGTGSVKVKINFQILAQFLLSSSCAYYQHFVNHVHSVYIYIPAQDVWTAKQNIKACFPLENWACLARPRQCGLQHLCQVISIWKAFGAPVHPGRIHTSPDSSLLIAVLNNTHSKNTIPSSPCSFIVQSI